MLLEVLPQWRKEESWNPLRSLQGNDPQLSFVGRQDDVISTAQKETAPGWSRETRRMTRHSPSGTPRSPVPFTIAGQRWPDKGRKVWRRGIGHRGNKWSFTNQRNKTTTTKTVPCLLLSNRPTLRFLITVTAVKIWNYHGPMNWSVIHNDLPFKFSLECI